MRKFYRPARMIAFFVMLALVLSIYGSALYDLQVVHGEEYLEASQKSVVTETEITAARGNILDRNGVVLVTSSPVYNITVSRDQLLHVGTTNETLLALCNSAIECGVEYNDTFPVSWEPTFTYLPDMTAVQREDLAYYLEYFDLDKNISATDLIVWLKEHYGIPYTTSLADARKVIGLRYELEKRVIENGSPYIFAEDVNTEFMAVLEEQNLPGVNIKTEYERVYRTEYAAHILGFTGLMNEKEYEIYGDLGYPMDAEVGKDGVELAFEEYLHGEDGWARVTTTSSGSVSSYLVTEEPKAGSNVYLTIDIGMQEVAERALADIVEEINATRTEDQDKADGGALVALDPQTGEVLALASYPTYDISTYSENYDELSSDETNPLFNRATMGTYNPGSTFKMVTSYAGLTNEAITRWTPIEAHGKYTAYEDYQPVCWIYPEEHGTLDVVGALANSCNVFFYTVADEIGMDAITEAAETFGFGSPTGIEIPEVSGTVSSAAYKEEVIGEGWWAGDTLQSAIGQMYNYFTPIQIAAYTSSIANGGTLYETTLLGSVVSHDYLAVEYKNEPSVKGTIDNSQGYINILQEGMEAVVDSGTGNSQFGNYKVDVAAKTGTVQSSSSSINSGVFVCYAPADDPEIAIAVVIEHGGGGSAIADAAVDVLDYYFVGSTGTGVVRDYTILP